MAAIEFPLALRPSSGGFYLINPSRSGGRTLDGGEQTVESISARWGARWEIPINNDVQVKAARAFLARLAGRGVAAAVPFFDGRRAPWPVDPTFGVKITPGRAGSTGYPDVPAAAAITAAVEGAYAAGETEIQVQISQGGTPEPGQYFGIGERLYLITGVDDESGGQYDLTFVPRLRKAVADGATVTFSRALCRMKRTSDEPGLGSLDMLRFGMLDLEFVEDADVSDT